MNEPGAATSQRAPAALAAGSGSAAAQLADQLQVLAGRIRRALASAKSDGGFAPAAVLCLLDEAGALTVPQLAGRRGTSRQNTQQLVNRLQARGFVALRQNPAHKRSPLVVLTAAGRAGVSSMRAPAAELEGLLGHGLSAPEVQEALTVVGKLNRCLQSSAPRAARAHRVDKERREPEPEETGFPINLL